MSAKTHAPLQIDATLCREELETVLASRLFSRAPSLSKMLSYVCSKYLDRQAESVTEWTVAVEGLGRRPDFSPEKDSIVRVEFHHLRKRLTKYYETDGAGHAIRIGFPDFGYVPQFTAIPKESDDRPLCAGEPETPPRDIVRQNNYDAPPPPSRAIPVKSLLLGVLLFLAVLAAVSLALLPSKSADAKAGGIPLLPPADSVRVLAGFTQPMYVDASGRAWTGDKYFSGGAIFSHPDTRIFRTPDHTIYNQGREGDFHYDIPVKPGVYELRLHFAETRYGQLPLEGADAERRFNVSLNGKALLDDFDVAKDSAEPGTATVKVWNDVSPAPDGLIHLAFSGHSGPPMVNGIEITPGVRGKVLPIRLICGVHPVYDRDSRFWGADEYYRGGRSLGRKKPVAGSDDSNLYQNVRFGNFSYAIPVVTGRTYQVSLWFADSTFNQAGQGLFDIFCNGKVLVNDFDIVKNAGGPGRGVKRVFRGVTPNAQGKLELSFVPNRDYASLSAMEVIAEDSL
jgi:hypothetical protein